MPCPWPVIYSLSGLAWTLGGRGQGLNVRTETRVRLDTEFDRTLRLSVVFPVFMVVELEDRSRGSAQAHGTHTTLMIHRRHRQDRLAAPGPSRWVLQQGITKRV